MWIYTTEGYVNSNFVVRLYVEDKKIFVEFGNADVYELDDEFESEAAAQAYLDALVDEMESDEQKRR